MQKLPPISKEIAAAARILRAGGVVAMPTETVYGLAADALNADAVAKIFALKKRPSFDPLIVHVASIQEAERVAYLNPLARKLAEAFWPGPFTMVLPKRDCIPANVTAGLATVGVRMPAHPVALALIRAAQTPLAAPSANLFGRISPTSAQHVRDQLGDGPDAILDGGPCTIGLESTIVEVSDDAVKILRLGNVSREALEKLAASVSLGKPVHERPNAPGQLQSHYAPLKPLRIFTELSELASNPRLGVLVVDGRRIAEFSGFGVVIGLSSDGRSEEVARNLYAKLREMEALDIDEIAVESVVEGPLAQAIMDRLRRAAARPSERS